MKQLYISFVDLYLDYVNIAWASENNNKLETFLNKQKHFARIINFKFPSDGPLRSSQRMCSRK